MAILVLAIVLATMLIMNGVLFSILRTAIRTTEHQIQEHFSREMASYDRSVAEKQQESMNLEEQLNEMKKEAAEMEGIIDVLKSSPFYHPHQVSGEKLVPLARYVDKNFFDNYRIAKDLMSVLDKRAIVENVKGRITYEGDYARFEKIVELLKMLSFDTVYELETADAKDQLTVLDETLPKEVHDIFVEYVKILEDPLEDFGCMSFVEWLEDEKCKEDPTLYVYTGDEKEKFDDAKAQIVTRYDKNICEGLRLVYQNQVYDYSICR